MLLVVTTFIIFNLIVSSESICFKNHCKGGCKTLIKPTSNSGEACCLEGGVGFAESPKTIGPGCYKCDRCVDVLATVDGGWGSWSKWSECSKSCGTGFKTKRRECDSPKPSKLGKQCEGDSKLTEQCNERCCPVDARWGSWSRWSDCSKTCDEGVQTRSRKCTYPLPNCKGEYCRGPSFENKKCMIEGCPVDGGWSDWSNEWSQCSKTCGSGLMTKTRECNNPKPAYGGEDCEGKISKSKICNKNLCPIHGQWSEWSEWSPCLFDDCSKKAEGGRTTRTRSCSNPQPQFGGRMCGGRFFDVAFCPESDNCPSDGKWDDWTNWNCTATGMERSRTCIEPRFGGKPCRGEKIETKPMIDAYYCRVCQKFCVKINGEWIAKALIRDGEVEVESDEGEVSGFGSGFEGSGNEKFKDQED